MPFTLGPCGFHVHERVTAGERDVRVFVAAFTFVFTVAAFFALMVLAPPFFAAAFLGAVLLCLGLPPGATLFFVTAVLALVAEAGF